MDEDDAVIAAWRQLKRRDVLLILVPRKPERFDVVAAKLEAAGVRVRAAVAAGETRANAPDVLLLDSIGELGGAVRAAPMCVFMGGTLAARGGHNILEPALFGKPVIVGPHMENFQAIAEEFPRGRRGGGDRRGGGTGGRGGAGAGGRWRRRRAGARVRGGAARGDGARGRGDARALPGAAISSGDAVVRGGVGALAGVAVGRPAAAGARLCAAPAAERRR